MRNLLVFHVMQKFNSSFLQNERSDTLYKEAIEHLRISVLDNIAIPFRQGTLRGLFRLMGHEGIIDGSQECDSSSESLEGDDTTPEIDYDRVLSQQAQDVRSQYSR